MDFPTQFKVTLSSYGVSYQTGGFSHYLLSEMQSPPCSPQLVCDVSREPPCHGATTPAEYICQPLSSAWAEAEAGR